MAIVVSVDAGHLHAGMWVGRLFMAFMNHGLQFEFPIQKWKSDELRSSIY